MAHLNVTWQDARAFLEADTTESYPPLSRLQQAAAEVQLRNILPASEGDAYFGTEHEGRTYYRDAKGRLQYETHTKTRSKRIALMEERKRRNKVDFSKRTGETAKRPALTTPRIVGSPAKRVRVGPKEAPQRVSVAPTARSGPRRVRVKK